MNANAHPSREQLQQLWEELEGRLIVGDPVPRAEVAHVSECSQCKRQWALLSAAAQDLRPRGGTGNDAPGPACPEAETIRALAGGVLAGPEADALLEHAADCDHCGAVLRMASEDFSAELAPAEQQELAALQSSCAAWQQQMAGRMRAAASARSASVVEMPARGGAWLRWAVAAAAVVVLAVGGLTGWRALRHPDVNRLLAQAYTEQRPMELRIAGAAYGPVRVERGLGGRSTFQRPAALLRAQALIAEALAAEPNHPQWLAASGRAELLNWNYEAAIKQLERARDAGADSPDVLIDLASAYFQRAASEGDRAADYGHCVELLGQVLAASPEQPVALFNRSATLAKLGSYHEAIHDLELYLRVGPKNDWTAETESRLRELKARIQQTLRPSSIVIDPNSAAPLLRERAEGTIDSEAWPLSLDEEYLTVAVQVWLPALQEPPTSSGHSWCQGKGVLAALEALSHVLRRHHGDSWLADLLASGALVPAHSRAFHDGALALKKAVEANLAGEPDTAIRFAESAQTFFKRARAEAALLRSREELIYGRVRALQTRECLREARAQLNHPDLIRYPWLRNQTLLWYSTCLAANGNLDEALKHSQQALQSATNSAFVGQRLRSMLFASGFMRSAELNWQMYVQGLHLFWQDPNNPFHAYESLTELAILAEDAEKWNLARNLRREAAAMIQLTPDRAYQAVAQYRLAMACKLANDLSGAEQAYSMAARLFADLPPSRTRDYYFNAAQVDLAAIELAQGKLEPVARRLKQVESSIEGVKNSWTLFTYYNTLGELHLRLGKLGPAEIALEKALAHSETRLSSLKGETDRLVWQREMGLAYRNLVAVYLQQPNVAHKALEVLEWYRASSLRAVFSKHGEDSRPDLSLGVIRRNLSGLRTLTFVSYVVRPQEVVAWVFDDRGIKVVRSGIVAQDLKRHVSRFFLLCSDLSSDISSVRYEGRLLYDALIAPLEGLLDHDRTIVFVPDDTLANLPWGALVDPKGRYFAGKYSTAISPGFGYNLALRPSQRVTRDWKALVVSIPSPGWASRFPPLPEGEAEARQVADRFHRAEMLTGAISPARIRTEMTHAGVFHFVGHAVSGPRMNGLVLRAAPPGDLGSMQIFALEDLPRDRLQKLQVVVLAACPTAENDSARAQPDTLVRSFLRAGVPHVLAARWPVESSATSETMAEFYKRLLDGAPVALALQQASATLREQPRRSHPFYWAAFSAYGH